jgi:hypothetical protein
MSDVVEFISEENFWIYFKEYFECILLVTGELTSVILIISVVFN